MEQSDPARQSSGIYVEADLGSQHSFQSDAELREHAAQPAGVATRTAAGVPVAATGTGAAVGPTSGWSDQQDAPPAQPEQPKTPLYKKRWFIITVVVVALLGIALLFIILFPVIRAIVQLVVKRTQIDIERATIMNPTNNSFDLHLQGNVTHTGIFSASIKFTENVDVFWLKDPNNSTGIKLGSMNPLGELHARNKRAKIDQTQHFVIEDQAAFSEFASFLITAPNFSWQIRSSNLQVQALKFPVAKGITFDKRLDLKGINSFSGNIVLLNFLLPRDDPAGGIDFVALTQLTNESPFVLQLGNTSFDLSYEDVRLGSGISTNTTIDTGPNNITLMGRLEPIANPSDLPKVSTLFTNYLNGDTSQVIARGRSTLQEDGTIIQWLSDGLESLQLDVPFKPFVPIDPIRSITIGDMALSFSPESPWTPGVSSNTVQAFLELPFGFHISIDQIRNNFTIVKDGTDVADLSTPLGASTSSIMVQAENNTTGTINITIANTSLISSDDEHAGFLAFNTNLTNSDITDFRLIGNSSAVANLSIGQLTLDPIRVNVSTFLHGLQGLQNLVRIESVDVTGGTTDAIILSINVTITNPSNLNLSTGDLTLRLLRSGVPVGTTLLPGLNLRMGDNTIQATANFTANESQEGLMTLNDFIGHTDVQLSIAGFDGSTAVQSLVEAFESLNISVILPGMTTNLLANASLTVLPTTGRDNNISHVTVSLNNPFSAPLRVTRIASMVTSHNITLGTMDFVTDFSLSPHSTTQSPALDFNMNFDPVALFTVTRALAVDAGIDPTPLDGIVQLGDIDYSFISGQPQAGPQGASTFVNFDLPDFVQSAFRGLQSDVQLMVEISIGDYTTVVQYSQTSVPTATDDSLNLILPILAQPIIERIVSGSALGLNTVMITNPQEDSFGSQLVGSVRRTGPFDAMIAFPLGLDVNWLGNDLGRVQIGPIQVKGDTDTAIDMQAIFNIHDVNALGEFTTHLIMDPSFDWNISGENLTVSAMGIHVPEISLPPQPVTLKGFNGLKDMIKVNTFSLPSDNRVDGGINLNLAASTTNPSDVGIELGTIEFDTMSGDTMIAHISTSNATLRPGKEADMPFTGRLLPQNNSISGRKEVSGVFNRYIAGTDSTVAVHGTGGSNVSWLNKGIKALQVETALPANGTQKNLIHKIDLNNVSLVFTELTAYNPTTGSFVAAAFQLPPGFNFTVDFITVSQDMNVSFGGQQFANLAFNDLGANSSGETISLNFTEPLAGFPDQHNTYNMFLANAVNVATQPITLIGRAEANVSTAVGSLSLSGIVFTVDSSVPGLQGLSTQAVRDVDVNSGQPTFLLITAMGELNSPGALSIGTGDVMFELNFLNKTIGTVEVQNMTVTPGSGDQPITVRYAPQDSSSLAAGRQLLESFLQGINVNVSIFGTSGSTPIPSLQDAFQEINFPSVTIPALDDTLIKNVSLVFPLDIVQRGIAHSKFAIVNPFTAAISITRLNVTAVYKNLSLGSIDNIDISSDPVSVMGHSSTISREIDFDFNLDPVIIIEFLRNTSMSQHVDLGTLDPLLQFVLDNLDFKPPVNTTPDPNDPICVSGKQFDIRDAILNSLMNLNVNLTVDTTVLLDEFEADLTINQNNISTITDDTALFLIGAVGGPIAQHLVDLSQLNFTEANITNITDTGFDMTLRGSLTNTGPLDASIEFIEPLDVRWEGAKIAEITLPFVCAVANDGIPDWETKAHVNITDQDKFTDFAESLLHDETFTWTINTTALRLRALETIFDNITLSRDISFKAFNNLTGVTIESFDLPRDDPNGGGIVIEADVKIPSPAQLGIQLGHVIFQTFFQEVHVGPLAADNLSLEPNAVTETNLTGLIVPQNGTDLETIGILFSEVLAGQNVSLKTSGDTIQPPGTNAPVTWLSNAFKTLSLNVILPARHFDVVKAIHLDDLEVIMVEPEEAFAPPTSSENTVAQYANPFGFSLQVVEASETLILNMGGIDAAQLDLPKVPVNGGVSTGNVADLPIHFENQTLRSLDNAAFSQLFKAVALTPEIDLLLKGSTNVTAKTTIGNVPITGVSINVTSTLKGIDSFGGTASLSNVSVTGSGGAGGNEYILAPLTTTLQNPSNISLDTVNVSLPVIYQETKIGRSVINIFDLVPGENVVPTEFHYEPDDANNTIAQSFLTNFIQTGDLLNLTIDGDSNSSPFKSLQLALDGLILHTGLNGLNQPNIITHVHVIITLESLMTNLVTVEFQVHNPLDADMFIEFVQSDSGVNGTTYAFFGQQFTSFRIKPGETVGSGLIPNVLLTQGALASLDIIPLGVLDVHAANTVRIGSPNGYQIPWLKLDQPNVPTSYDLVLGFSGFAGLSLSDLINQAKSILTHKSSISSLPASTTISSTGSASSGEVTGSTLSAPEETQSANDSSPSNSEATPAPAASSTPAVQPTADAQPTTDAQPEDKAKASSPATVIAMQSASPALADPQST